MSLKTFKRGVHPHDGKDYSKDMQIRKLTASQEMVYPLSQSIGALSRPVVEVGDEVLKGQLIAEAGGYVSANIHSSVSGKVKAIEKRAAVNGKLVESIIIENDKKYDTVEGFGQARDLEDLTASDIVSIVKKAGIVGLGGAGFPTHVKLNPNNKESIDTIIINGAECEPYLTSDYRIMLERTEELMLGIKAILKAFPNAKAVIGIENNKPDAVQVLTEHAAKQYNVSVQPLKTKYPQGGERQLIYAITGRKINSKLLPSDANCVVFNISTCYAIYEAVYRRIPLVHRIMTITGEGVNKPANVDVPIGVSHAYVLEQCGGAKESVVKFISGGPMMGMSMYTLDVPVQKTSSSILAFEQDDVSLLEQSSCIHCGKCLSACPQSLVPQMMAKAVKTEGFEQFAKLNGMECIECGCCAFVCPAKIPLVQLFKHGKAAVRKLNSGK